MTVVVLLLVVVVLVLVVLVVNLCMYHTYYLDLNANSEVEVFYEDTWCTARITSKHKNNENGYAVKHHDKDEFERAAQCAH